MKKDFSNVGLAMSLYLILSLLVGMLFSRLIVLLIVGPVSIYAATTGQAPAGMEQLQAILDALAEGELSQYVYSIPTYFLVIPFVLKLLNGKVLGADKRDVYRDISPVGVVSSFCILFFLGILGNLLGQVIVLIYEQLSGTSIDNLVEQGLSQRSPVLLLIITVILTPIFEELIYRYGVISKIGKHGGINAVLVSAVIFALAHRNIFQLFYTFFAGLIFGYIYVYTGKLRYSICLHMMFNFFGAFLPMMFAGNSADVGTYSKTYTLFEYGIALVGLIILIFLLLKKRLFLFNTDGKIRDSIYLKESFANSGMLIFILICLLMSVLIVL